MSDFDNILDDVFGDEAEVQHPHDQRLLLPAPTNPMKVAARFIQDLYQDPAHDRDLLVHSRNTFYRWDGRVWPELEENTLESLLYKFTEDAIFMKELKAGPEERPWEPNTRKIGDLKNALKAVGHLPQDVNPPAWLGRTEPVPADEVIAVDNGLLHVPTRVLLSHRPEFWSHNSLAYSYDPDIPVPERWLTFLEELWGDDVESIETLQEIFGYILTTDTRQQKMFLIVGPPRSGKGTIARVLTGLLGEHNRTAVTLAGMATDFGLQDLVDKPLAIISDARLSGKTDGQTVVEQLLRISGEDAVTINRKYRDHWSGKLPTRFLMLTNELPRFTDSSGALASRFIILNLTRSFYDNEDPTLTDTLLEDAAGIMNWALDGLDRLRGRGYFQPPASSVEAVTELHDLASPVSAFLRDKCDLGPEHEVDVDVLYQAWRAWATDQGHSRIPTKAMFGRDLKAKVPSIKRIRPRDGEDRAYAYLGIRLKPQYSGPRTNPDHPPKRADVASDLSGAPVLDGPRDQTLKSQPEELPDAY